MTRRPFSTDNLIGHSETRTQNLCAIYAACVYLYPLPASRHPRNGEMPFFAVCYSQQTDTLLFTFVHDTQHILLCPLASEKEKKVKTQSTMDQPQSLRLWQTQYFHLLGYSHCDSNAGLLCHVRQTRAVYLQFIKCRKRRQIHAIEFQLHSRSARPISPKRDTCTHILFPSLFKNGRIVLYYFRILKLKICFKFKFNKLFLAFDSVNGMNNTTNTICKIVNVSLCEFGRLMAVSSTIWSVVNCLTVVCICFSG